MELLRRPTRRSAIHNNVLECLLKQLDTLVHSQMSLKISQIDIELPRYHGLESFELILGYSWEKVELFAVFGNEFESGK